MNESIVFHTPDELPNLEAPVASVVKAFPVWSGWDILFLIFFTSFSAIVLATLGNSISHLLQVKFSFVRAFLHPDNEGIYLIIYQGMLDGVILLFIFFTITLKYNSPFLESIKWRPARTLRIAPFIPLGILLALSVLGISTLFPSSIDSPIEKLLKQPHAAFLFASLGIIVAPFVEEVMFRGFIYPVAERWVGTSGAVLFTAALFAGVHVSQLWGSWPAMALISIVGLTLSIVRAKTDSLFPSFVIHLAYNTTISILFIIGVFVGGFPA